MTRDRIYGYFIEKDNNCTETMLCALNDKYQLGIPDDSIKLVGGFGEGMSCGKVCSALYGGCSAISYRLIEERTHATSELKPAVAALAEEFVECFGSDTCCELVKTYKKEDTRCLNMICVVADIADVCFGRILSAEEREQRL